MALGVSLKLAKAGWWQGDPGKVMRAPADEVIAAAQYEAFLPEFERAVIQMNKEQ